MKYTAARENGDTAYAAPCTASGIGIGSSNSTAPVQSTCWLDGMAGMSTSSSNLATGG
jgi:hypothetical protein